MKEKTKLRVIQILCIVSLLITVFSIQRTYAKYYETVGTTYATDIKKWVINLNEKNIHNETILSNVMIPQFFYNEHMTTNGENNGVLVPGREGYFDFLIDYTNVDVAFKFSFNIEQLNTTVLEDFEVYGYKIVDSDFEIISTTKVTDIGEITKLTKDENGNYKLSEITQVIDPTTESEKEKRILVLFRWYDGEENNMDNMEDTEYIGKENGEELRKLLNYKVKITFTQTIQ